MKQTVEIIMYHYVRELPNTRYPDIRGLLLSHFREQLMFLLKQGRNFVSADQVLEAAHGGTALPKRSVLLTFDDGYLDHYTNVNEVFSPVLNELRNHNDQSEERKNKSSDVIETESSAGISEVSVILFDKYYKSIPKIPYPLMWIERKLYASSRGKFGDR